VLHVFIRDSLPNEENPSAAAEFTTGRWNVNNEALLRETTCALRSATETLSSISKIMLQQSNNTVEIDKTGYTLASAVKALNPDQM
jgi:hypothetical protein